MYICRKQNHSDLRARKRKAGFSECRFSFALNLVVFNQRVFKLSLGAANKKAFGKTGPLVTQLQGQKYKFT